jgi:4-amino-4-deoxy-L-arabinose transferase-like glycosyltransferase
MASEAGVHRSADARRAATLPFFGVLAVAFATRVADLDYNGPFIDESFHSIVHAYGNVPYLTGEVFLYPQISRFVHAFAGGIGARALSALFGTLTVACVYRLAERIAGHFVPAERRWFVGAAAALLYSLSPPALFVSGFANYYALSVFLFALGLGWTLRGVETGRPAALAAGAVALVAAFATRAIEVR